MSRTPTGDLVVLTWLRSIPALANVNVSNLIPRDDRGVIDLGKWGDRLVYVTGRVLPSGSRDDVDDVSAVVLIDCWARAADAASNKVPWERANAAAESIASAASRFSTRGFSDHFTMPSPYSPVCLDGVEMIDDISSVESRPQRLAHYTFLLSLNYSVMEAV